MKSYFLSCEEAETVKVKKIIDTLHNPLTRPILQFLSYILPSRDKFNKVFQKSKENITCQLFQEMSSVEGQPPWRNIKERERTQTHIAISSVSHM